MTTPNKETRGRTPLQLANDLYEQKLKSLLASSARKDVLNALRPHIEAYGVETIGAWISFLCSPDQTKRASNVAGLVKTRIVQDDPGVWINRSRGAATQAAQAEERSSARRAALESSRRAVLLDDLVEELAVRRGRPVAPQRAQSLTEALSAENKQAWDRWKVEVRLWMQSEGATVEADAERILRQTLASLDERASGAFYWRRVRDRALLAARACALESPAVAE